MALQRGYTPAKSCTGSATPGGKALMSWYLGAYRSQGAADLGVYVCKGIAGSTSTSVHAEGRAADLGTKPYRRPAYGKALANALVNHSLELGIQCVIHDRKIWSSSYPDAGWRDYLGEPHDGHLHVELTWAAARTLTAARIEQVIGGKPVTPVPDQEDVMTPLQAQQLRDAHYTTTAIPHPTVPGKKVPLHVWAGWMTDALKALATAVGNVDEAVAGQLRTDLAAIRTDIAEVPEELVAEVAEGAEVDDIALRLQVLLGDNAGPVGLMLAAGAGLIEAVPVS